MNIVTESSHYVNSFSIASNANVFALLASVMAGSATVCAHCRRPVQQSEIDRLRSGRRGAIAICKSCAGGAK